MRNELVLLLAIICIMTVKVGDRTIVEQLEQGTGPDWGWSRVIEGSKA